jgi:sterol-4alpha-carboxylate 3-dehydrogenase (decarboxylating)
MKILVIGGGGFLGRRIVEMALERNHSVSVFDIKKTFDDDRLDTYFVGDLGVLDDLMIAFAGIEVIIHTASPPHGANSVLYHAVNVQGTSNIITAAKRAGVPKLVFTSSASVIYNGNDLINADETTPYCDVHMDAYNESKALAELMVLESNAPGRFLTVALRPSGIFGPRDAQGSLAMAQAAKRGQWRVMIGSNDNLFDMTYVDNAAYAHILAAEKIEENNGIAGQVYLIDKN